MISIAEEFYLTETKETIRKKFEQHTNKNIFSAFCELINQILIADSIEFNSFKTKIFAINLNSIFEFQFQSIKSLIRRSDTSKTQYHYLKSLSSIENIKRINVVIIEKIFFIIQIEISFFLLSAFYQAHRFHRYIRKITSRILREQIFSSYVHYIIHDFIFIVFNAVNFFLNIALNSSFNQSTINNVAKF